VAVFEFKALEHESGANMRGTVVAKDKLEAYDKLRRVGYDDIRTKELKGFDAFWKGFSADVK